MKSYKIPKRNRTSITLSEVQSEAETMEMKIQRMETNGEQTEDPNVPISYTERKNGVPLQFDIRTDKWLVAQEGMAYASESNTYTRENNIKDRDTPKGEEIGD